MREGKQKPLMSDFLALKAGKNDHNHHLFPFTSKTEAY
jgi:hypothetical protein